MTPKRLIRKHAFGIVVSAILLILTFLFLKQKKENDDDLAARFEKLKNRVPKEVTEDIKYIKEKYSELELETNRRIQELLTLKQKLNEENEKELKGLYLSLPSIYSSLPHLKDNKAALNPSKRVSKERRGVTLAFGIPTVRRSNASYLMDTIQSMIDGLTPMERNDSLIIVFIAELNMTYINTIASDIQTKFPSAIAIGLLEIIAASSLYYPDLDSLPSTFGDKPDRVKWRAKQNLDYAYLMMYAQSRALYYVQLEDDVVAKSGYAKIIKTFAMQQVSTSWLMLEFSSLGFIGKAFHSHDLSVLVQFFLIFYKDKPNDWLLDHVFHVKACHPEKDNKNCNVRKNKLKVRYRPSLFQHVGKESSLKGKRQLLIDKDFKKLAPAHSFLNPKATVLTTLEAYKQYTAQRGYLGHTIFWALPPHKNSFLRIIFHEPHKVRSFMFKSGNTEHPGDILVNASISVLEESVYVKRMRRGASLVKVIESKPIYPLFPESEYEVVGHFNNKGLAEGVMQTPLKLLREVVIRVLCDVTHNWVIISEFFIETEDIFRINMKKS